MNEYILSRTQCEIGPFLSLFNSEGNIEEQVNEPKFNITKNIISKDSRNIDKTVIFNLPKFSSDNIKILWIHVILPKQETINPLQKIFFSNQVSGLDILKKIKFFFGSTLKKTITKQEYEQNLINYGYEKYNFIKSKYFNLHDNLNYINRLKNKQNQRIDQHVFHIPIFFEPNPFLQSGDEALSIEISFTSVSKLFTTSKHFKLNEIVLTDVCATAVYEMLNDYEYFYEERENIYENESTLTIEPLKENEYTFDKNIIAKSVSFNIFDESFNNNEYFYGRNIHESVLGYLNSCLKPHNDSDTCFNLKTLAQSNASVRTLYTISRIDKKTVQLLYNEAEYKTIIHSPLIDFDEFDIYLDVDVSDKLNLFWFEYIEIDAREFNKHLHAVDNTKIKYEATKLINGLYIKKETNKEVAIFGVSKFRFNYKIEIDINKLQADKVGNFTNSYLTQKHFDVYFSLPVSYKKQSCFAEFDYVILDLVDWKWMDLDGKYEWEFDAVNIDDIKNSNFKLEFNKHSLFIANNDKFNFCRVNFVPINNFLDILSNNDNNNSHKVNNGYFILENLKFSITDTSNNEFYDIKKDCKHATKKFIYILQTSFRNKLSRKKIDIETLKRLSKTESCLELVENHRCKKFKNSQ